MNLKIDCLAKTPLPYEAVAGIYGMASFTDPGQRQIVRNLCLSHERLRAELEGAEKMLESEPNVRGYEWLPCQLSVCGWSDIHRKDTWERSMGDFHGGTTWSALVHMEPGNYQELRQAASEGAHCQFLMYPEATTIDAEDAK